MFAAIPFDQQVHDTYFVVAHFHFVIFGAAVFPILGGMYYWFPKVTGRMYHERLGQVSFWLTFVGTFLTFFPMHIVGLLGMPRRDYTYPPGLGWALYNLIETIGAFVLAAGLVLIVANLVLSCVRGPRGRRPVPRRHARVGDHLAAAALQLRGHPDGHEPVPELGRRRPRARQRAARRGRGRCSTSGHETPASTVQDGSSTRSSRCRPHSPWPLLIALALAGVFALLLMSTTGSRPASSPRACSRSSAGTVTSEQA